MRTQHGILTSIQAYKIMADKINTALKEANKNKPTKETSQKETPKKK